MPPISDTSELPQQAAPAATPSPLSADERAMLAREFTATIETLDARGLYDDAETLARQMVELLPDAGIGWKTLAWAHLRRGDLTGAFAPLSQALALLPNDTDVQGHYSGARALQEALALDAAGRYAEAGDRYRAVLTGYPQHAETNHRLGVVEIRLGRPQAALPYLETAIGANPNNGQFWANYIDALLESGQIKAAWLALEMGQQHGLQGPGVDQLIAVMSAMSSDGIRVHRVAPGQVQPVAVQPVAGQATPTPPPRTTSASPKQKEVDELIALFNNRRLAEAEKVARQFVERFPEHPVGWKVLAASLYDQGRYDESLPPALRANELAPRDVMVLQAIAVVNISQLGYKEAEAACRKLLNVDPDHVEGVRLLAVSLMFQGQLDEAERQFMRAQDLAPQNVMVSAGFGTMYLQGGRISEAAAQFRRAIELDPSNAENRSNLLFAMTHGEMFEPDEIFSEHKHFGEHYDKLNAALRTPHTNTRDPDRPLRIGFVSGDFRRHAVANFIEPMMPLLARIPGLLLYAYSSTPSADFVTERLRRHFSGWRNIFMVDDAEVDRQIRADGIDILIDLSGHTAHNRLPLFARKPAPVQASWIGYPGTTGLASVDYFFADRFWVPDDHYRKLFTEKIAYLPAVAPFQPEQIAPPINPLPALSKGYVTFGSFNRLDKIRRDVAALWARLLHAVPNSRLLIGAMPTDGSGEAHLIEWFGEQGIARDRLEFRSRGSMPVFQQQHHQVDICLDTFPFGGLTTALHSLGMGVPTLTLPGRTVPGRSGATAMSHAGLAQFVADDPDDFVRRGVAIADDLPALAALRAGMRERCQRSPMFQPEEIARGMGEALRTMWKRWCADLPAETFSVATEENALLADKLPSPDATPDAKRSQAPVDLYNAGRIAEAEAAARQLTKEFPHHPLGWKVLGLAQYRLGGSGDDVLGHLLRAHNMLPGDANLLQVLAALLETKGRSAEAAEMGHKLVTLMPNYPEGLRLYGIALISLWRFDEAERACKRAAELDPQSVLCWNTLGMLYLKAGRLAEGARCFRRAIELGPEGELLWCNLMLCLQHDENVSPETLYEEHRRFGVQFETQLKTQWPQHENNRERDRTLRVGFVSGDFCRHPVTNFLEPVLVHLARDKNLSLYAYSSTPRNDSVTARLRGLFAHWRDALGLNHDIADLIRADGIDILIDLSGHTAYNRLLVFARKPAPVQASWIGYPGTTGLTAIDYFLADRFWVPDESFRAQFVEKIAYLPAFAAFRSELDAPPVNTLPALNNGYVTFGSFNRVNKLRPDVIKVWAQLLHAVPDARMLIAAIPDTGDVQARLTGWFEAEGITCERLIFRERGNVHEFLAQHHEVDIALDAFPFSGLTTVLQSLWMGVPTLTLPGLTVPARSGATAMSHAGLTQFVAHDADDFVRRGAALANDVPALAALREGMRERCLASPMFQPEAIAQSVSAALRTMWHRWCDGLPAESFETTLTTKSA
jgi:predicted O-linked N-acetylglucosamine transferase (SPINDLY family)